ncbi:hypothetical protein JNW88_08195 [Micromonospora sp. ATA32]|nr:hypothetical protein [Micromonospora sp. ATA32]
MADQTDGQPTCGERADQGGWFRCSKQRHPGERHTAAVPGGTYTWGYVPTDEEENRSR